MLDELPSSASGSRTEWNFYKWVKLLAAPPHRLWSRRSCPQLLQADRNVGLTWFQVADVLAQIENVAFNEWLQGQQHTQQEKQKHPMARQACAQTLWPPTRAWFSTKGKAATAKAVAAFNLGAYTRRTTCREGLRCVWQAPSLGCPRPRGRGTRRGPTHRHAMCRRQAQHEVGWGLTFGGCP